MIQRQITHAPSMFAACTTCGREPRHYVAHGTTSQEYAAFTAVAERHQLECVCERRTGWCGNLSDAMHIWNEMGALPAIVAVSSKVMHRIRTHRIPHGSDYVPEHRYAYAEAGEQAAMGSG